MNAKFEHELIVCIVNEGFSDAVMEVARSVGAKGGTILHAHGAANKDAETFFGITIQPNKELLMILVPAELRPAMLDELYHKVGLNTPGQGIAFALPVDGVVGIGEKQ